MERPLNLPDLSGLTVLVVDDNGDSLEMLTTFLKACGARALAARNAPSGLAFLYTTPKIDVLITDLSMPEMDGVELLRRLREHPRRASLPAIALTGFYEQYMDAGAAGFDAFLRKPVDLDGLCETIRSVIAKRR